MPVQSAAPRGDSSCPNAGRSATVVVSRVINPGMESEFDQWVREVDAAARRFPGHRGNVRLQDPGGVNHLVYQFDSEDELRRWEASEPRRRLVRRGDELSRRWRQMAMGLDAWFAVPGQAASPKWKTFVATWLAVYPTLLAISYGVYGLLALAGVPHLFRPLRLVMTSMPMTAALTWIVMPRVTRLLRPWLMQGGEPAAETPRRDPAYGRRQDDRGRRHTSAS
jgi:antibiotic biosynthesis monooxygenase (ABM) superfamily enzyme